MKRKEHNLEAQATHLLARMDAGEVGAVGAYADLAQAQGWPCHGFPSWVAWALAVRLDLVERQQARSADRLANLERLPVRVADQVYQQAML